MPEYEILTPSGFSTFDYVRKTVKDKFLRLHFLDQTSIECSFDHKFKLLDGSFTEARKLRDGDSIDGGIITWMEKVDGPIDLYDPVNVSLNSEYISGSVISHNCSFIGSSNTLIHPNKLRQLAPRKPVNHYGGIRFFEMPIRIPEEERKKMVRVEESPDEFGFNKEPALDAIRKDGPVDHLYIVSVDVSRGKGIDNSAFTVIDVTEYPYKQVAAYHNPDISPLHFPDILHWVARLYNNAAVLIENNDMGSAVANTLHYDIEYPNVISLSSIDPEMGIKTSKKTKRIGCSNAKDLIENDKLIVCDPQTIVELTTFVQKKDTFMADDGTHDDLVMCLVIFGYLTTHQWFIDLTDMNLKNALFATMAKQVEDDLLPFGYYDDGTDDGYDPETGLWREDETDAEGTESFFP